DGRVLAVRRADRDVRLPGQAARLRLDVEVEPARGRAVDLELVEGEAPLRRALREQEPHVPSGAGDLQVVEAAVAVGDGADRGPRVAVGRGLDLVPGPVRRLPVDDDPAQVVARAEVHRDPLRVAPRAAPPGAGVAVHGELGLVTGL